MEIWSSRTQIEECLKGKVVEAYTVRNSHDKTACNERKLEKKKQGPRLILILSCKDALVSPNLDEL